MTDDKIEIIERTQAYRGYLRVDKYRLRHVKFDGSWTGEVTREVIERGHAVAVLPYDPVRDEVLILEQFRIPAHAAGKPAWQLEIVAGVIEPGETREDVARRETLEECGRAAIELIPICEMLTSPGVMTETVMIYCGHVDTTGAGGIHGLDSEDEDIRVLPVAAQEAIDWLRSGRFLHAPSIVALQWLALQRRPAG